MSLDNDRDAETYDVCALDKLEDSIVKERVEAHAAQKQQAKKMLESSEQRFAPLHIGSNVRIAIGPVDRPKIGHRNLMGVVIAEENGFYTIGTSNGSLNHKFLRNQLHPSRSLPSEQPLVKHQFMENKDTNIVYVTEDAQQIDVPARKMIFFATPDVTTV
ncbi:unnamed protein product, partial [Mesorhabditis belari]|uniref:Uncharacterized protein n=1 Tax=Mesorhabditis belari TaxID=2138241 RepID=A0AAF3ENL8_9BILA